MGGELTTPRVALIQDGTEVARQEYADVLDFFRTCCDELSTEGLRFPLEVFTDRALAFLLEGISPEQVGCLVFASNALLSDAVRAAVVDNRERLKRYVAAGGGLVVLHQFRPSLDDLLPEDLRPALVDRADWSDVKVEAEGTEDVLLSYPTTVRTEDLREGRRPKGPRWLYWKTLPRASLSSKMRPVLTHGLGGADVLLARTRSGVAERVVLATMPLDWQGNAELTKNAIRYACLGEPRRLLWRRDATATVRTELFLRWIYADGATAVRPIPEDDEALDPIDEWLLSRIEVCVVPGEEFDRVRGRTDVQAFLARGGTVICAEPSRQLGYSRVQALVGGYTQRVLEQRLQAELQAVEGWETFDNAFKLRNIVSALALLRDRALATSPASVLPSDLAHLVPGIRQRLTEEEHREDLSSSIALGEVLCHLMPGSRDDPDYFAWMEERAPPERFDVKLQIRALRSLWLATPDPGFLPEAATALALHASSLRSLAPIVRVLDAIAMLDQAHLLEAEASVAAAIAAPVCEVLDRIGPEPGVGWMSIEASADIARGVVALLGRIPAHDSPFARRLAAHLATCVVTLRQAVGQYDRDALAVAWLARVIHAIILADASFPLGVQRLASLKWPLEGGLAEVASGWEESLIATLAAQNSDFRRRNHELDRQRLAARVGRATATVVSTAVLVSVAVLLFLKLGTKSPLGVLANLAWLLSTLLASLGATFQLLNHWDLLAAPAQPALAWAKKATEVLPDFGKFKSRSER